MKRRTMIAAVGAVLAGARALRAEQPPYRVSLLGDAFDGAAWHTGVRVEIDDGWKTYWRMPGDAGIPPQFTWTPSRPAGIEVFYPVPDRFNDASGETVGYKHDVVFPVVVKPRDMAPLDLRLEMFLGVCREVCIPARGGGAIPLGNTNRDPAGSGIVEAWMRRVPVPADFVEGAEVRSDNGKPVLMLALSQKVDDIFVDSDRDVYARQPQFSAGGATASLALGNVRDAAALRGAVLRLTARTGGTGLEQAITLS